MKKILYPARLVLILLCLFSMVNIGQSISEETAPTKTASAEIADVLAAYKKAALSQDAKGLVAVAYPVLFKVTSKDEVIRRLKNMYERRTVPTIKTMTFTSFGQPQPYSKGHFVMIDYSVRMELHRPGDATPQIDKIMTDMMVQNFGLLQTKVSIDEKNNLVVVERRSQIFALNEEAKGWSLMDDDQFRSVLKKYVLPEDLAKKIWQQRRFRSGMGQLFCEAANRCYK